MVKTSMLPKMTSVL